MLKLSHWGARALHEQQYHATLRINLLPQMNPEVIREQMMAVRSQLARRLVATSCPVPIPRRLWERLIATVGIDQDETRWADVSNKTLNQLIQELTQGQYIISGKGIFKEEFVTCGGIKLNQVDFRTMESRQCPGLYLAGEVLDIDGVTGASTSKVLGQRTG